MRQGSAMSKTTERTARCCRLSQEKHGAGVQSLRWVNTVLLRPETAGKPAQTVHQLPWQPAACVSDA